MIWFSLYVQIMFALSESTKDQIPYMAQVYLISRWEEENKARTPS